jgi:hypothetical protein
MNIQQFFEHHSVRQNPFAEEDAQTDPVFKDFCIASAYHPTWDKVYGNPADPATSIVFGEKGAGKTAMRLQIVRHLEDYNRDHPESRVFTIEYDDFNPFLDRFRNHVGPRRPAERVLAEWKLWDHMDAILSLGVTQLTDAILGTKSRVSPMDLNPIDPKRLSRHQARDLLLLAASYDQSTAETIKGRWQKLRRKLRFRTWLAHWPLALGCAATVAAIALIAWQGFWNWLEHPWVYLLVFAAWLPWITKAWTRFWLAVGVRRNFRVGKRDVNPLRQVLMHFSNPELSGQPLPNQQRTDDRYEMLAKFQGILETLGFSGMVVLVDRVDEPHLINGATDMMKALLWPMLDNKFLKVPGIGFKLLLPIELAHHIEREDRDFYQRARLDKQNMIPSLDWTGEALYDVANARLKACAKNGNPPNLKDLFEPAVTDRRLMDAFRTLRVPRHMFKFLYRVFVAHCNAHTEENPSWKVSAERFETSLALYQREQDSAERGMRVG